MNTNIRRLSPTEVALDYHVDATLIVTEVFPNNALAVADKAYFDSLNEDEQKQVIKDMVEALTAP